MNIPVVLPISGRAERFWPIHNKHFLCFLGKPLIYHAVEQLLRVGFTHIVLTINESIKADVNKLQQSFPQITWTTVVQGNESGMGGALSAAREHVKGRVVIISPHDVVESSIFDSFISTIQTSPDVALVVSKTMDDYFPGGYVISEGNHVKEIIEKPAPDKTPSSSVALVFYYFPRGEELIESIGTMNKDIDPFEPAISAQLAKGLSMKQLPYNGYWGYIKYPWNVLPLMDFFLKKVILKISPSASISSSAHIEGDVHIEDGAKIYAGAAIVGPTYIGKNVIVGHNALIRHSHIDDGSVIGYGSEVARSYIGKKSWFHTNYVGDSVIAHNVSIGAGGVLANLRLDEGDISSIVKGEKVSTKRSKLGAIIGNDVRIGVNVSVMPGVKIGSNACVGPGIVVSEDIPNNKAYIQKQGVPTLIDNAISIASLKR